MRVPVVYDSPEVERLANALHAFEEDARTGRATLADRQPRHPACAGALDGRDRQRRASTGDPGFDGLVRRSPTSTEGEARLLRRSEAEVLDAMRERGLGTALEVLTAAEP